MVAPRWEGEMQSLVQEAVGWRTRPALASLRLLRHVYLPWLERRLAPVLPAWYDEQQRNELFDLLV